MKKSNSIGGHTFYGSTSVGERGQMVIPIKARKDFKIKNGEELLVFGSAGKFLSIVKLSEVKGLLEELEEQFKGIEKLFEKSKSKTS